MKRMKIDYTVVQSQKAVSAYFTSKQILPFGFAEQYSRDELWKGYYNMSHATKPSVYLDLLSSIT